MKTNIKELLNSNILKNKYVKYGLILILGLFLGWLLFGGGSNAQKEDDHQCDLIGDIKWYDLTYWV